jgi:hypothetical protein
MSHLHAPAIDLIGDLEHALGLARGGNRVL